MRVSLILITALIINGCVPYPIKEKPNLIISVVDSRGQPIPRAKLYFAKHKISITPRDELTEYVTNEMGQIEISGKRDWQLVILAPDGASTYSWGICVEKEGFIHYFTNDLESVINERKNTIILKDGSKSSKCSWSDRYFFK